MFRNKLLIIGSIPHKGIGETYGGTTVLMQSFLDYCKNNNIDNLFIQSNKYIGTFSGIRNFVFLIGSLFIKIRSSDVVMINATARGTFYLSPIIFFITRLFGRKIVLRKFGGDFHKQYLESPNWKSRLLVKTILRADALFFETLEMVEFFKTCVKDQDKVHWFPNVRNKPKIEKSSDHFQYKFVFISHLKKTKGVLEIIAAANTLPEIYSIDLYGPILDDDLSGNIFETSKVNYKGILTPEAVIQTLSKYDVLLLPTYHPGEGYPGIIIEALSLGLPIISTEWQAIPEIITHGYNGLLVPPRNSEALKSAILEINHTNFNNLSNNAKESFSKFDQSIINQKILHNLFVL